MPAWENTDVIIFKEKTSTLKRICYSLYQMKSLIMWRSIENTLKIYIKIMKGNKEVGGNCKWALKFTQYKRKELNPTYIEVWLIISIERNKEPRELKPEFSFLPITMERNKCVQGWTRLLDCAKTFFLVTQRPSSNPIWLCPLNALLYLEFHEQYWILTTV